MMHQQIILTFLILGLSAFVIEAQETTECVTAPTATGGADAQDGTPKWYYNQEKHVCYVIGSGYSGAKGNTFDSELKCYTSCQSPRQICSAPPDAGLCKGYFEKYAFNLASGTCKKFVYGGCPVNGNKFDSVEDCESVCSQFIKKD
ncbi:thrombin inhibitor hemalin-like [Periplaneta americana]|uniref:thrombin inhibitor hemalin-like n=1 Tax=Periplaneta americana TaxID=6978 RepID=UPI0037E8721A